MIRSGHFFLAALPFFMVAAAPAWAASRQLAAADATALEVDSPCARQVTITPDQAAGAGISVTATADHQQELDLLVLTGGPSAKLSVPQAVLSRCWRPALTLDFQPTLVLAIHVPPGTPMSIDESSDANYDLGAIGGPLSLDLSGAVHVKAASVTAFKLDLSGAGGATVARANGPLQAELSGYGSLDIADATLSAASLEVSGAGSIHIHNGTIGKLNLQSSGAASVSIGGTVGDASIDISGAGSVNIAKVTGALSKDVSGIAAISIGGQ